MAKNTRKVLIAMVRAEEIIKHSQFFSDKASELNITLNLICIHPEISIWFHLICYYRISHAFIFPSGLSFTEKFISNIAACFGIFVPFQFSLTCLPELQATTLHAATDFSSMVCTPYLGNSACDTSVCGSSGSQSPARRKTLIDIEPKLKVQQDT